MKIKTVCEKTGLTDRTIRYYIEEGLVSPSYTENYLGRKSFDFSDDNICELNDIAILRFFNFSIDEIRSILSNPQTSTDIIKNVKGRISLDLLENKKKINVLSLLKEETVYTVSELAKELSKPTDIEVPNEAITPNIAKKIYSALKGIFFFLATWLSVLISVTVVSVQAILCDNPIIDPRKIILTVVLFIPSVLYIILSKIKLLKRHLIKTALFALCVLCIPFCTVFSLGIINECDHNWNILSVETPVSCSADGKVINQCNVCRATDIITIKKKPHTEVIRSALDASCYSEGLTEGKYCSVCNTTTITQTIIPKKDHTYIKSVVSATCAEGGYTLFECRYCENHYFENVIPATEEHNFVKNEKLGYKCKKCQLEVCEYGYADGSYYNPVKYYITGIIDPNNEVERTLVIYGKGNMPNYSMFYHPWRGSTYLSEVTCIIISEGITSIADGAFEAINDEDPWMGNPFQNVKLFVIKNKDLKVKPKDPCISGIECGITYTD